MSVKIAVVDTGIDKSLSGYVHGGIAFHLLDDHSVSMRDDVTDCIGHGTQCTAVICRRSPNVSFYIVKILNNQLQSHSCVLIRALQHLLDINVNIINLSLATASSTYAEKFNTYLNLLHQQNKIVIASHSNDNAVSYPAALSQVIGVKGHLFMNESHYWFDNQSNEAVADLSANMTKSTGGIYYMFGGNSKATALMTSMVANILNETTHLTIDRIKNRLQYSAKKTLWCANDINRLDFPPMPMNMDSRLSRSDRDKLINTLLSSNELVGCTLEGLLNLTLYRFGLNGAGCYRLLKDIEKTFAITFSMDEINCYTLYSLGTISRKVGDILYG